ncbi:MAG: hypothetical protein JW841_17580 [Deltaproteobacteria bacterium]|nr:hypothetical protein [Deltaproteobacteria bacterium]
MRRYLLCIFVASSIGCSGQLLIQEPEEANCSQGCPGDTVCHLGFCVPKSSLCGPQNLVGSCNYGYKCISGVCYAESNLPAICGPNNPNGLCDPDFACVNGACTPIPTTCSVEEPTKCPCSPDNPQGLCQGGLSCVLGYCFDSSLICSPTQLKGFCLDPLQTCVEGSCVNQGFTCDINHPDGSCPSWQVCIQGQCGGPIPDANACSLTAPQGICPANEVCVGGTCVSISDNRCTPDFPTGLCGQGAACLNGLCQLVTPDNECSPTRTDGLCSGGGFCISGDCVLLNCEAGGYLCPDGKYCIAATKTCVEPDCAPSHPTGLCTAPLVCDQGYCLTPSCEHDPGHGTCFPPTLICNSEGNCVEAPCTPQYPNGVYCETPGDICVNHACVNGPCSEINTDGTCDTQTTMCVPIYGCTVKVDNVCCDEDNAAFTGCTIGVCSPPQCGDHKYGACPSANEYCDNNTCTPAECSVWFRSGVCTDPNETCYFGVCSKTGCREAGQTIPGDPNSYDQALANAYCAPGVCDTISGICSTVGVNCSPTTYTGSCPNANEICCTPVLVDAIACTLGVCIDTGLVPCLPEYPGGHCPNPEICVLGDCKMPPCSPTITNGACPTNQVCCDATLATTRSYAPAVDYIGSCVPTDCSYPDPDNTNGWCASGSVCCNKSLHDLGEAISGVGNGCALGSCVSKNCSPQYPYGTNCGSSASCINGACVDLCSTSARDGWCPTGFACVDGGCAVACAGDADCDGISDTDEGGLDPGRHTDSDGSIDARDRDSDGDSIFDQLEGVACYIDTDCDDDYISDEVEYGQWAIAIDTDGDLTTDMLDTDSDNDGILDRCEGFVLASYCDDTAAHDASTLLTDVQAGPSCNPAILQACDYDNDGTPDFRDDDSDNDGIIDNIEARSKPTDASTVNNQGVDHDIDGTPDYRDIDSDADGVNDVDEDVNYDGFVNCQVDGTGAPIVDSRLTPVCSTGDYDYNPGCEADDLTPACTSYSIATCPGIRGCIVSGGICVALGQKCLLAESSRVHADTDGDGINDGSDGVYLVCSEENLKPINIFYSRTADYALALEQEFTSTQTIIRSSTQVGLAFDDTNSAHGSYAVSGFVLNRIPGADALAAYDDNAARNLIVKAVAQSETDRTSMQSATEISAVELVINRTFSTFDGYGAVVSRYNVTTSSTVGVANLRNTIVNALDGGDRGLTVPVGPTTNNFTVIIETVYRCDPNTTGTEACTPGVVMVVGAVVPTSTSTPADYGYDYRGTAYSQIPLFYIENITSGSALAQFGDDTAALCQSLVQKNGKLDFIWVVDNSGSMAEEIDQVQQSATLFFALFNNTEADYRIGQVTTAESDDRWHPPVYWEPRSAFNDASNDESKRIKGMLIGDFTGAIAGIVDTGLTDRTVGYDCLEGCFNGQPCCPACPGIGSTNDPACYFASRLPDDNGSGREFGLLMAQWAAYRAGAQDLCTAFTTSETCLAQEGCTWVVDNGVVTNRCMPDYCNISDNTAEQCNGNDSNQYPYGLDGSENELEPTGCEWHPDASTCWPSIGIPCTSYTSEGACDGQSPRCSWNGTACVPDLDFGVTLCSSDDEAICEAQGGGWCEWDTDLWGSGQAGCRPPLKRAIRPDADKFIVTLSDEEECYLKDIDYNGDCEEYKQGSLSMTSSIRLARQKAYRDYLLSRGFMSFGIVGDKTAGCSTAEPCNGVTTVAESTGGGWGSICATNLYPTIEAIVITSIHKASPYVLEGFINNHAVQPIAATIKVTTEVCNEASEYPLCGSGTHMITDVPRSRTDGFDYDAATNTLVLYGNARPKQNADIVVSYRYWIDNEQPAAGDPDCPCPETDGPDCLCLSGQECGISGTIVGGLTDNCATLTTEESCGSVPGCAWADFGSGLGLCMANGLCERRDCQYVECPLGQVCDPEYGVCVCDITCSGVVCGEGDRCDNNSWYNNCHNIAPDTTCEGITDCSWRYDVNDCYSDTCGQCVCDTGGCPEGTPTPTDCEGGCPAGQYRNSDPTSPDCGKCFCDTSCRISTGIPEPDPPCPTGQTCDANPSSFTCGFCTPPQCGECPPFTICNYLTGECICDTTCGGGCGTGEYCDDDDITPSPTCGQCLCDTTCGGSCPDGRICDDDDTTPSPTCGQCLCDTTCGYDPPDSCPAPSTCDDDPVSFTCGLCISAADCGGCPPCSECNPLTLQCYNVCGE